MFEISLVPDIKGEMIKAQKVRNWVLFGCIVVSAVAIGVVAILMGVKGGQDIAMNVQEDRINKMSEKLNDYSGLNTVLSIQDQLGKISTIDENRTAASRIFALLTVMKPTGEDKIALSSLNMDLENNTIRLEGQANAGMEPYIDYRVLESLKKNVARINYDYGEYVDEEGNTIPTYCIEEEDEAGNLYVTEVGEYYAKWYINREGCHPAAEDRENTEKTQNETDGNVAATVDIYRTPKFNEWYADKKMDLDGTISGVAHFNSNCITYTGAEATGGGANFTSENTCLVAPDGLDVTESSSGRDANEELVLTFNGTITVDEEVFLAKNHYMMMIGPEGQNVTDSYVQIKDMFTAPAKKCAETDTECKNNANGGK